MIDYSSIPDYDSSYFPAGRKPGLIEDPGWSLRGKPAAEGFSVTPRNQWERLAERPEFYQQLRGLYPFILDQDGFGSCAPATVNACTLAQGVMQGMTPIFFNELGMYNTTSGGRDQGSVIGENVQFAIDDGCFPEEVWPRSKGWKTRPTQAAFDAAAHFKLHSEIYRITNMDEFVSALLAGFRIAAGYSGHAVSFFAYVGNGRGAYMNSWGDWGDNGVGILELNRIHWGYGAYAFKNVLSEGWRSYRPKYDQELLAHAVHRYMKKLNWAMSHNMYEEIPDNHRDEMYGESLRFYGLSV